jgi:hypothetical protein
MNGKSAIPLKPSPKAISVDKQITWLIFSSGIDVAATRP